MVAAECPVSKAGIDSCVICENYWCVLLACQAVRPFNHKTNKRSAKEEVYVDGCRASVGSSPWNRHVRALEGDGEAQLREMAEPELQATEK
jgi:hypothetical protein